MGRWFGVWLPGLPRDRPGWLAGALVALAICDGVKHAALMTAGPIQPWPDSESYWRIGADVAQGDFWQVQSRVAFRTPVYPWLLGLCQWSFGGYALLALILLQHALEWASSWLTMAAVWQVTRSPKATVAAYAFCVILTARHLFANTILTESLAVFLTTMFIWLLSRWIFASERKALLSAAVCLGVAILQRPAAVAFLPALIWAAATTGNGSWRQRAMQVVVAAGITAAVVSPWCLRNALLWHRFTVSVFLGRELWTANFSPWPGAQLPVPETGPGRELREALGSEAVDLRGNWSVAGALARRGWNDADLDDLMKRVSLQAIGEHPREAALHFLARCLTFWYVKDWELDEAKYPRQDPWRDQVSWSHAELRQALRRALTFTPERFFWPTWIWSAVTWVGVLNLLRQRESRRFAMMLGLAMLGLTVLTAALEIPCYRYRCILEPAMVIASVAGLAGPSRQARQFPGVP